MALPESWKSGSGSQGSQIYVFDKEIYNKMIASRGLAKYLKSGSGKAAKLMILIKTLTRN